MLLSGELRARDEDKDNKALRRSVALGSSILWSVGAGDGSLAGAEAIWGRKKMVGWRDEDEQKANLILRKSLGTGDDS